jgi:hypothetical protein
LLPLRAFIACYRDNFIFYSLDRYVLGLHSQSRFSRGFVCGAGRSWKSDVQPFIVMWLKPILYRSIGSLEVEVSCQLQAVAILHWENIVKVGWVRDDDGIPFWDELISVPGMKTLSLYPVLLATELHWFLDVIWRIVYRVFQGK